MEADGPLEADLDALLGFVSFGALGLSCFRACGLELSGVRIYQTGVSWTSPAFEGSGLCDPTARVLGFRDQRFLF